MSLTPLTVLAAIAALVPLAGILAAPAPAEKEPDWMPAFRKAYELKEGEYVRRVAAPYVKERLEFYMDAYQPPKDIEADRRVRRDYTEKYEKWLTLVIDQEGRRLTRRMTVSSAGLSVNPAQQRGDNLLSVHAAVLMITGYEFPECIIEPTFAMHPLFEKDNLTVHGDFVVRRNAPMEKLAPQLEAILNKECKIDIQLRVDQVEQEVVVVSGAFELKPPEWRETKTLDVYATETGLNKEYDHFNLDKKRTYQGPIESQGYSGAPSSFVRFLGNRTKSRMVWDDALPTGPSFSWNDHKIKNPDKQEAVDDRDPDKILKHAAEQTGLKFTKAKRKVPVLVLLPKK